jgi:uncharacterized Ntn-hydrolase superfamily protein
MLIEFNTFTITARCPRTGALGVCMATGEMAVGSRVPNVRARVGAVATQAMTDPRLGPLGLELLQLGYSAPKVLSELADSDPGIEGRQLAVVDADGNAAARTGTDNRDWKGHHIGDGYVAMGNRIIGEPVVAAIAKAFEDSEAEPLHERMMRAIEAGRDAGGQPDGQRSAAMLLCEDQRFPIVNLRVDEHTEPVGELRRLLDLYTPLLPYYRARASNSNLGTYQEWLAREAG